jgi:hypothetical protein
MVLLPELVYAEDRVEEEPADESAGRFDKWL